MGMNLNPMTLEQINNIMNQNPILKPLIYSCIQDPILMNQVINILNVLNYNPLIMNQMRMQISQEMMNMNMMMFNNQMMNQRMEVNNFEDKQKNEGSEILINFRRNNPTFEKQLIKIYANPEDRVSTIIKKYRKEGNDYDEDRRFIFNARILYPSVSLREAGITNNSNVFVVVTKGVQGG